MKYRKCSHCSGTGKHLSENETYYYACVTCSGNGYLAREDKGNQAQVLRSILGIYSKEVGK